MAVQSNLGYRQRRAQTVQSTVYAFLHAVVVRSALGRLRWLTFFPLPGGGWRSGYRLLTLRCPPPAASGNSCRGRAVAVRPSLTSMHTIYFFIHFSYRYLLNFEKRMLYGALVVTLWTCYGALWVVVLLLLLLLCTMTDNSRGFDNNANTCRLNDVSQRWGDLHRQPFLHCQRTYTMHTVYECTTFPPGHIPPISLHNLAVYAAVWKLALRRTPDPNRSTRRIIFWMAITRSLLLALTLPVTILYMLTVDRFIL